MDLAKTDGQNKHGFLNRNMLKYFAVICMLGDHLGFAFVEPDTVLSAVLEFLGGFTMPIMAFSLAEGYCYTKNLKRYFLRLLIFALIAAVPFCYLQNGSWLPVEFADARTKLSDMIFDFSAIGETVVVHRANFLFTLLLSLANIAAWDKLKVPVPVKVVMTVVICWLATGCDWSYWCVLISFIFWKFREKNSLKWVLYSLMSLSCVMYFKVFQNPLCFDVSYSFRPIHFSLFLVIPLIAFCYNGEKGKGGKFGKWFFYIFYPAHMLVIDFILFLSSVR